MVQPTEPDLTPTPRSRWRTAGLRLLLVVASTAAGLAVVAPLLRAQLAGHTTRLPADDLQKSDVPGIPWLWKANLRDFTNNQGLQMPYDITTAKPPGTFRILVLGDSVTSNAFGPGRHGVRTLYPAQLEHQLAALTHKPVQVLELAVPGLSLAQEMTLLQARGLAFDPDVVLFGYCYNDPIETDILQFPNLDTAHLTAALAAQAIENYRRQSVVDWYAEPDGEVMRKLRDSFAQLGAWSKQRHIAVVGLPVLTSDRAKQPHLAVIEPLAAASGVAYVDLFDALTPADLAQWRGSPNDDLHLNEAGHAAIAHVLARKLLPAVQAGAWPPPR